MFVFLLLRVGLLYTYLSEGVGNTSGKGVFRAVQQGFVHWSSGCLDHLEVNTKNPNYCHVRCQMTPSMKAGLYHVTLLLVEMEIWQQLTMQHVNVLQGECNCN